MAIDSLAAARAYLDTARTIANSPNSSSAQEAQGAGFGNMLDQAVSAASGAGQTVETAMVQAATGRADLVDVVIRSSRPIRTFCVCRSDNKIRPD